MSTLFDAMNASGTTTNGAVTNISSLNKNVDLFFLAGASRGKDITPTFAGALAEDTEVAVRILQWARDARGGAGERNTFRQLFGYLIKTELELARRILPKVSELGRWDDLLITVGTNLEKDAFDLIANALVVEKNGLCAKWMPRQGEVAAKIRNHMKYSPKAYRKLLVGLSNTVEQKMCAQDWANIEYAHVPSVAAARYQKAFLKHDNIGYTAYKNALVAGTATINASAIFPYDVIRALRNGDTTVASAQWSALPDYLDATKERILPVVDVSGSMGVAVSGSVTAMDVAISLGLYLSERNTGVFKDKFITYSENPKIQSVSGDLTHRYNQMQRADWGMSTNIAAVFDQILSAAITHKVSEDQMPTKVLILSDMEFNQCIRGQNSVSAFSYIQRSYQDAGYNVPQLVFWNINGRAGNSPVRYDETGTALVSGFSPSIVKSVLGGDDLTPLNVMLKTVMTQRYDF